MRLRWSIRTILNRGRVTFHGGSERYGDPFFPELVFTSPKERGTGCPALSVSLAYFLEQLN